MEKYVNKNFISFILSDLAKIKVIYHAYIKQRIFKIVSMNQFLWKLKQLERKKIFKWHSCFRWVFLGKKWREKFHHFFVFHSDQIAVFLVLGEVSKGEYNVYAFFIREDFKKIEVAKLYVSLRTSFTLFKCRGLVVTVISINRAFHLFMERLAFQL